MYNSSGIVLTSIMECLYLNDANSSIRSENKEVNFNLASPNLGFSFRGLNNS